MNIKLTRDQEKIVKEELKTGHFRNAEEVVGLALETLRGKERSSPGIKTNSAQGDAVREMIAFVEENRVRLNGVSIEELIREGRRL